MELVNQLDGFDSVDTKVCVGYKYSNGFISIFLVLGYNDLNDTMVSLMIASYED